MLPDTQLSKTMPHQSHEGVLSAPHRGCPVAHAGRTKTMRDPGPHPTAVTRDASGVWHIWGFAEARAFLRAEGTRQAGFQAERLGKLPKTMRDPILFQEGQPHREQRTKIARFFTPKTADERYRGVMEALADEVLLPLTQRKEADLSEMSARMAVAVAAHIVGLTDSRRPGLARRIEAFFAEASATRAGRLGLVGWLQTQASLLSFFLLDVQPAIRARRAVPREDVISHALSEGYKPLEILTECVTYAAAGMATTREFIGVAAWHLLASPELRARYLAGPPEERYKLLHELLRLEPVIGMLFRRALQPVSLESGGARVTIPAGAKVALHIGAANTDERVVGDAPLEVCPARPLPRGVPDAVMSFGDGYHRCPGAYVAIQESDIFLTRLLALPGLRLGREPDLSYSDLVQGYELRTFRVRLD